MSTIHAGLHRATCRSCGASIMWATTSGGNRIPINLRPNPAGNVLLDETRVGDDTELVATVLRPAQIGGAKHAGRDIYTPHFRDCPHADKWRHKKTRRTRR